jgi:hypothetical protein
MLNVSIRRLVGSHLCVVPYQILELRTTLHIHIPRLPQFQRPATRNGGTYRLDKRANPESHQSNVY